MFCAEYQDVEELINHYKTKQAEYRRGTKIEAKKSPDLFCVSKKLCLQCCQVLAMLFMRSSILQSMRGPVVLVTR